MPKYLLGPHMVGLNMQNGHLNSNGHMKQSCSEATAHSDIASYSTHLRCLLFVRLVISISSKQVKVMKYCQLYDKTTTK